MNGTYDYDREWNDAEEFERTQLRDDITKEDVADEGDFVCKDCGELSSFSGDDDEQTICEDCLEIRHDHEIDMRRER